MLEVEKNLRNRLQKHRLGKSALELNGNVLDDINTKLHDSVTKRNKQLIEKLYGVKK